MPELDGVSLIAIASFAALVIAWLAAPSTTVEAAEAETEVRAAA